MARERLIDACSSAWNSAEERVERNRLVCPEELNTPLGRAARQRRVPRTGAIATLARERILRLSIEHRSRGRKRQPVHSVTPTVGPVSELAQALGRVGISLRGLKRAAQGFNEERDYA